MDYDFLMADLWIKAFLSTASYPIIAPIHILQIIISSPGSQQFLFPEVSEPSFFSHCGTPTEQSKMESTDLKNKASITANCWGTKSSF